MNESILKILFGCITAGIIATPLFVVDRINAESSTTESKYATKESVIEIKSNIKEIKEQQKDDHDLLVKIGTKIGVDK